MQFEASRAGPDLDQLKAGYLESLVLKNYSPLSVRQKNQNLRIFLGWLKGRGITDPAQVDAPTFEQYKAYLSTGYVTRKGKPLCSNTIIPRLYNVQNWFDWMRKKGVVMSNLIAGVKLPKMVRILPRGVLRQDEIRKVMAQPDLKTPLGYRDRIMMEVLYSTGVRARELVSLRVPDVDLDKKAARVRNGKGGKDRFVPLSTPCCRFVARYVEEIRPELVAGMRPCGNNWIKKAGTAEDFLFVSAYGGTFSSQWLNQLMTDYLRKAGITRPVSPVHGFRHSVATHLIEDGMDVRYVQAMLGHNSINSTAIYTHVERGTLHKMLKHCHPRELAGEEAQPYVEKERKRHAVAA
ncbi:MAG: tyrosine-type recombinase/integrase [Elusimicrobia bacterium]|nr:tyrosine-type recombinase/integrase [Elusimicrobiota bacterium]